LDMSKLEKIIKRVLKGEKIEIAAGKFDWRDFEHTIGDAFRYNDFQVSNNVRFKMKRRYEIDLIAERGDIVFCIDCKRWSEGRDKTWSLSKAAADQQMRAEQFRKYSKSNLKNILDENFPERKYVPIIVTLHQENILQEGKTFVVPIGKLNTFILNYETII
jgi:hypothetical protein